MKRFSTTSTALPPTVLGAVGKAWDEVSVSFDRFCLAAGMEALGTMMETDAEEACGPRHARGDGRRGYRWGRTQGKIGFHGGKVEIERPRVRGLAGKELALSSWEATLPYPVPRPGTNCPPRIRVPNRAGIGDRGRVWLRRSG
jgi:hypothetical protein